MSDSEEKKKGKGLIIILIVLVGLLTAASGLFAYKAFVQDEKQMTILRGGKESAEKKFDKILENIGKAEQLLNSIGITDIDSTSMLADQVAEIQAYKKEKEEKIAGLKSQINELISASGGQAKNFDQLKQLYSKLKTEVYLLRSEVKKLKAKNQALIAENDRLKKENLQLGEDLAGEKRNSQALSDERDGLQSKVNRGKRLVTFDVVAEAIKIRRNGREKTTTRASRADKIRVVFTIAKNEIVDAGNKKIYLRVVHNDIAITDGGSNFDYKGNSTPYTSMQEINYQNASTDVYMYAENLSGGSGFSKGDYKAEVYCDNAMIGFSAFTLK